jgi:hypothetical protein
MLNDSSRNIRIVLISSTLVAQLAAPPMISVPYTTAAWILTELLPSRNKGKNDAQSLEQDMDG